MKELNLAGKDWFAEIGSTHYCGVSVSQFPPSLMTSSPGNSWARSFIHALTYSELSMPLQPGMVRREAPADDGGSG